MLLLTLLARTSANDPTMRLDTALQDILVASVLSPRGQRDALTELESRRLVAEVHARGRDALVVLDPELRQPAPTGAR